MAKELKNVTSNPAMLEWQIRNILAELSHITLHSQDDECPCNQTELEPGEWCIAKHCLSLSSLASETALMSPSDAGMWETLASEAMEHHKTAKEIHCKGGTWPDLPTWSRAWRKRIEPQYYHMCKITGKKVKLHEVNPEIAKLFDKNGSNVLNPGIVKLFEAKKLIKVASTYKDDSDVAKLEEPFTIALAILGAIAGTSIITSALVEQEERNKEFIEAQKYCDSVKKPLLVIGTPKKGFHSAHPCGDVTIDLDPNIDSTCKYQVADVRKIPYPDKHFGAAYCSHVLEHMLTVEDCAAAIDELDRVADRVFVLVPKKTNIYAWLMPEHKLWVTLTGDGYLIESREGESKVIWKPHAKLAETAKLFESHRTINVAGSETIKEVTVCSTLKKDLKEEATAGDEYRATAHSAKHEGMPEVTKALNGIAKQEDKHHNIIKNLVADNCQGEGANMNESKIMFNDIALGAEFETGVDADGMEPYYYKISESEAYQTNGLHEGQREKFKPEETFYVTGRKYVINKNPTEIERAALTLLIKANAGHPGLNAWIRTMAKNPDEMRDIDTFIIETPFENNVKDTLSGFLKTQGYVTPLKKYDFDNSVFAAIIDHQPKGIYADNEDDKFVNSMDDANLRLAHTLQKYRFAGRPEGEQTSTIRGMGSDLLKVSTSLAAAVVEYHHNVINNYIVWLEK